MERYGRRTGLFFMILGSAGVLIGVTQPPMPTGWFVVSILLALYGLNLYWRHRRPAQIQTDLKTAGVPSREYRKVPVVGMSRDKGAYKDARIGDVAKFVQEPWNPNDSQAVLVNDAIRRRLGYLKMKSEVQSQVNQYLQSERKILATIDSASKEQVTLHIRLYD